MDDNKKGLELVNGGASATGKGGRGGTRPQPRSGKPKDAPKDDKNLQRQPVPAGEDNGNPNPSAPSDDNAVPPAGETGTDDNKGQEPQLQTGDDNGEGSGNDEELDKGKRDGLIDDESKNKEGGEKEGQLAMTSNGDGVSVDDTNKGNPMLVDTQNKQLTPFERQTRIEKSSTNVSIKSLFKEWKKDQLLVAERKKLEAEKEAELKANPKAEKLPEWDNPTTMRFDEAVQRNDVWTDQQKSDLIHSILYGYYIPPVLAKDTGDGKKWFLDGRQRITTIMTFLNGQWALSKKTEDVYGHKIAGFKFNDLPEDMKDEIMDETITIVRLKHMTTPERDKMFVKLNSGSPLSRIELTRAKHSEMIEGVNALAELKFFKTDLELSKKARVRFVDQEIILQIAMLFEEGKEKIKGFGAGQIEEYVLRLKGSEKTLSDEMVSRFEDVANYLDLSLEGFAENEDEVKKALKKIHVPIIFYCAEIAIKKELDPTLFGHFIHSFLVTNYSVTSKYGKSCQAGSSKKDAVITRIDEMTKALEKYMELIKSAPSVEEGKKTFDNHLADENGIERQMDTDDVDSNAEAS